MAVCSRLNSVSPLHSFHIGSTALQCGITKNTLLLTGENRAVCTPVGTANQSSVTFSLSLSFSLHSAFSKTGERGKKVGPRLSVLYKIFEPGGQVSVGTPNQSRSSWRS